MSERQVIPFWGPQQIELFTLMAQAIDPEERIPAAMQAVAPISGRELLDIGAGVGDRTILYARLASQVYALEPDPTALSLLRGRVRSSGAANITVVPADVEGIPLDADSVDVAYATWSYFFGPGSEPGLREVERVLRPGGDLIVVQNYGHDELSKVWTPQEAECEQWPAWFEAQGFSRTIVDTVWRFQATDEAATVLEFLWGQQAGVAIRASGQTEFGYKVAIYHRNV